MVFAFMFLLPYEGYCKLGSGYYGYTSAGLQGTGISPELLAQVKEQIDPQPKTEDLGGKLGVGYDDGISVRYWMTDGMAVDGILKLQMDIISGTTDEFEIRLGGRIRPMVIAKTDNMILSLFAGLDIYKHTGIRNFFDEKEAYISACGGLCPEIFIFKSFSVEIPLGVYFQVGGGQEHGNNPYTMISLGTFGERFNLNAGLVFHAYFGLK